MQPGQSIRSDAAAAPPEAPRTSPSSPPARSGSIPGGSGAYGAARSARSADDAPSRAAPEVDAPEGDATPEAKLRDLNARTRAATDEARNGENGGWKSAWIVEPSLYEHVHNWLADVMPFRWRERARRVGFWRRRVIPAALVIVAVVLAALVGNFGISVARQMTAAFASAPNTAAQPTTPSGVIISPLNNNDGTPTPAAVVYSVGVWTSDTMPAGGGVKVFVRVSKNTTPVPGAKVYLKAFLPGGQIKLGPATTDAYGVASFNLRYGAGSGTPIYLVGSTTIQSKTYSGSYTFVTM